MVAVVKKNITVIKKATAPAPVQEPEVVVVEEPAVEAVSEELPWADGDIQDAPEPEQEAPVSKVKVTKPTSTKKVEGKQAVATMTTTKVSSGQVVEETQEQEVVGEEKMEGPCATVTVGMGITKNLGNYESIKFNVSIAIPCAVDVDEIEETYTSGREWIDGKINEFSAEVDAQL